MKFSTKAYFTTTYKEPRRTATHKQAFYDEIEVDIAEIAPEDAPIATRTPTGKVTRWHDGRHFAALPNPDDMSLEEMRQAMEWHYVYGIGSGYECFSMPSRVSLYRPSVGVIEQGPRIEALEMVDTCFDRAVLIDGAVWIECAEPYLMREHDDAEPRISIDMPSPFPARPNHRSHSWLFHSRVKRADDPEAEGLVTVLVPESIKRQPERDSILDAARFLLEDYSGAHLKDVHPDVMSSLTDLHRVVYGRDRADIDCETLVDPLTAMLDAMEAREESKWHGDGARIAAYRGCVTRWIDRDLDVGDLIPPSGPRL